MEDKLYQLMDWKRIEAIIYQEEEHPETILGGRVVKGGVLYTTYQPNTKEVFLHLYKEQEDIAMEQVDENGFYRSEERRVGKEC